MTRRHLPLLLLVAALVAGCGTDASPQAAPETAPESTSEASQAASAADAVIDADTAVALLADRDDLVVVDVRTPAEFEDGHLADAMLLDVQSGAFEAGLADLDPDGAYVVYCRTGVRSAAAVERMLELGFTEVYDAGGFADLAAAGADVAG